MSLLHEFGHYRLDPAKRILLREGVAIPLPPKAFDLALLLASSRGRALSRSELIEALWPDTVVEEANLSFQVSTLRKALGEEGSAWIETIPRHGYRFAADVRTVAPDDEASPAPREDGNSRARVGRRQWPTLLVGIVGTAVAAYLAFMAWGSGQSSPGPSSQPSRPVPLTSYPGFQQHPSLSPDGSQVAFAWNGANQDNYDIYVRLVGPGPPIRLTTDPAADRSPAWSPDGRQVAFMRFWSEDRAGVFVIPALGGGERKLADVDVVVTAYLNPAGTSLRNLSWSKDGRWIAVAGGPEGSDRRGIWLIPMDGGPPRRLAGGGSAPWLGDVGPALSPTGESMAFLRFHTYSLADVFVQRLTDDLAVEGEPTRLTCESGTYGVPAWTPDSGGVVFPSGAVLGLSRLQRIEVGSASPDRCGEVQDVPFGELATAVSVSSNGRLVYQRDTRDSDIWELRLSRSPEEAAQPVRLVSSAFDDHTPHYSPDGRTLAFASMRSGTEEVWTADADGTNPVQLTSMDAVQAANPRWSPGGRTILFDSRSGGSANLFVVDVGSGSLRQLTDWPGYEGEASWSRDGKWVRFGSDRTGRYELWKQPVGGGAAVQITKDGGTTPRESPDGRWLYYAKDLKQSTAIWRVPPSGGEETEVVAGLSYPSNFAVAEDGIYFLTQRAKPGAWSIDFYEFASETTRSILRTTHPWGYGVTISPDESTLLYSAVRHAGGHLMLVEGFR